MKATVIQNRLGAKPAQNVRFGITRGQALIFLLAFSLFFYLLTELVFASEATQESPSKLVTIQPGDSLWKLAIRHQEVSGMDVQELVQAIRELNDLDSVMIYPGQNIKIPLK